MIHFLKTCDPPPQKNNKLLIPMIGDVLMDDYIR